MPACCQRRGEMQDHLFLHQFSARCRCRACRFSHHVDLFVVVIFSLRTYAQHVFSALYTGVLNTIACVCRRGVSGVFPAGLRFAFVSSASDSFGQWKCLPIFYRGLMCMCCVCVCVRTHTHTACGVLACEPGGRDETPGEPGRNPDVL